MNTTIATLTTGDVGTIASGKFEGREFTVRTVGASGRTVMVNWTEQGTTGVIRSTTPVTVAA